MLPEMRLPHLISHARVRESEADLTARQISMPSFMMTGSREKEKEEGR